MRKRHRIDKIVEWVCPSCDKIFSSTLQARFISNDLHPRCDECGKHLIRKVAKRRKKESLQEKIIKFWNRKTHNKLVKIMRWRK